jgi:2-hydroxychromene-2-carboxylate isomerase
MPPPVEFWFEFASTCSYPVAMRIEELAAARGRALVWRPSSGRSIGSDYRGWCPASSRRRTMLTCSRSTYS